MKIRFQSGLARHPLERFWIYRDGIEVSSRESYTDISVNIRKFVDFLFLIGLYGTYRITDVVRTSEDTQRLKEQGYFPSDTSKHLTGDAIDITLSPLVRASVSRCLSGHFKSMAVMLAIISRIMNLSEVGGRLLIALDHIHYEPTRSANLVISAHPGNEEWTRAFSRCIRSRFFREITEDVEKNTSLDGLAQILQLYSGRSYVDIE